MESVDLNKNWREITDPYKNPTKTKSILQIVSTFAALFLTCYISYIFLSLNNIFGNILALIPAIIGGGLTVRVFIIMHDCGHGSFFKNKKANDIVGAITGAFVLTPYLQWTREHAKHHATSGNLSRRGSGDVYMLTLKEYQNSSLINKINYRIYRNPWFLFTLGAWFHFFIKQRAPYDLPLKKRKAWKSVLWTNVGIVLIATIASQIVGFAMFAKIYVPMMLIGASLGTWIFYMQHQYEDTYWEEEDSWKYAEASTKGSSFYDLPKILHWFSGNIGYHHIHHLCSAIPNYNLPKCFEENSIFQDVTKLSLKESLHCANMALWDEANKKMISFKQIPA